MGEMHGLTGLLQEQHSLLASPTSRNLPGIKTLAGFEGADLDYRR